MFRSEPASLPGQMFGQKGFGHLPDSWKLGRLDRKFRLLGWAGSEPEQGTAGLVVFENECVALSSTAPLFRSLGLPSSSPMVRPIRVDRPAWADRKKASG